MYIENPDPKFERLENETPRWFLHTHRNGKYAAMQVLNRQNNERAAIWDKETGQIVWEPDNANALCWTRGGMEVLAVREHYQHNEALHYAGGIHIVSRLQSEITHTVELWTWPNPVHVYETPLVLPTGWIYNLFASPIENTACVMWRDQTEAGIEWIAWDENRIWQEEGKGYFGKKLNGLHDPVFSPDGKYVVLVYAATYWWFDQDDGDEPPASPGGAFRCGRAVVCDSQTGTAHEMEIFVDVPKGFAPDPDTDEDGFQFTKPPVFTTNQTFGVCLGNGEIRTFDVK